MITASWNKYLLLTILVLSGLSLSAQENLDGERLRLFNEQFFAAQNAKLRDEHEKALVLFEALYQKDPQNPLVCYELAQLYAQEEAESDAIFYAERAFALDPENPWYLRLQLAVYGQFGKNQLLVQTLNKAVLDHPEEENLRFQLAEAYYRNGQIKESIEELDKLENQVGLREEISNQKKSLYLEVNDLDGARLELEKLIKAFPQKLDYQGALGQLYQANNEPEKALEIFQGMLEVDSLDPRPHLDLANYYQQSGEYHRSLYHLKKAMTSKQLDLDRKVAVLLSLFDASQSDSALTAESFALLDQIVAQEPADARIYALYGDYLSREGRDEEAVKYYKQALEYGEKFQIWEQILLIEIQNRNFEGLRQDAPLAMESFPNQPLPYLLGGIAAKEGKDYPQAQEYLEDGLAFVFNNARLQTEFHLQLAEVYHYQENHSESDYHFEEVLAINPSHAGALNNFAYYLSLRKEKLQEALKMSTKANEISPNNAVYLDTKAWILYQLGRFAEAQVEIEKALGLMPQPEAEILTHYGDILWRLEKYPLAKEQYQKALNLEDSEALRQKLNQVP